MYERVDLKEFKTATPCALGKSVWMEFSLRYRLAMFQKFVYDQPSFEL